MKPILVVFILFFSGSMLQAQVENSTSLRIDAKNNEETNKFSLSKGLNTSNSEKDLNLFTSLRDSLGFNRTQRPFSMNEDNGLLDPEAEATPRWFKKDADIAGKGEMDQYFGDFKSNSQFIHLVYRDHGQQDGDVVRIFINGDIIKSGAFLTNAHQRIKINMVKGLNKIDILALNEGESSPNTAEFHLYDDQGIMITANQWNLLTGGKASMIVRKD
ncbi:hypothetical protein [Aquimarina sp. MMG016]|uniref:hypothetical protein n=1 Tax=Aquimarina sp. MMG016 TaxID=2822690 RepID=UPI001B3A3960|nr:hypothetical protein [Aquimarina sp. MMG016]MBQ4819379.1 hypothetical protein [Aquimarina sp. MMG016]